jgi:hypothetical protein
MSCSSQEPFLIGHLVRCHKIVEAEPRRVSPAVNSMPDNVAEDIAVGGAHGFMNLIDGSRTLMDVLRSAPNGLFRLSFWPES